MSHKKITIVAVKDALWGDPPVNVNIITPLKKANIIGRVIRKVLVKIHFLQAMTYNRNLMRLDTDIIIVFDSGVTTHFLNWLKKNNPSKRIILWYWNPVALTISPDIVPPDIEKWSYSQTDCNQWGLFYNTQFFFSKNIIKSTNINSQSDIYFVGRDKGRAEQILYYKTQFERLGLKAEYHIIKKHDKLIPYSEILQSVSQTKCVFDYCVNETAGMSLRALEAMFMSKKVITNNQMYRQEAFYDPSNIFILGENNLDDLKSFFEEPYVEIDSKIKNQYLFESWLERFL